MSGMAVVMGGVVASAGQPWGKVLPIIGMFGGLGLMSFTANLVRLPGWARKRERQMEALAEYAVKLLSRPKAPE